MSQMTCDTGTASVTQLNSMLQTTEMNLQTLVISVLLCTTYILYMAPP